MRRILLLAPLALLGSACIGGVGSGQGVGRTSECTGRPTEPLSKTAVVATLHEHGLRAARSSTTSDECKGLDTLFTSDRDLPAFAISNDRDGGFEGGIHKREGTLHCLLYPDPAFGHELEGDTDAPAASPIFSGRKAQYYLENLECTFYPNETDAERQIARVSAALHELAAR